MASCAICKFEVNPLHYGKLKLKNYSKIKILDENVKEKETLLNITLCDKCAEALHVDIIGRILGEPQQEETAEDCGHDCANCDNIR